MAKQIYLAGPLFNRMERAYNQKLKEEFAELGYDILLPQDEEFKVDATRMMVDPEYATEKAVSIAMSDFALIDRCVALLINLDGITTDSGACVELGYAFSKGMPCFAIQTDTRKGEFGLCANMMVIGATKNRVGSSAEEVADLFAQAGL